MKVRTRLAALAVVFLVAHLPFLPPTLEDVDSINFALGVRDFDVARHQPHPPGYPIFIALAKASTAAARAAGVPAPETRGLAIWSVLAGAALVPLLFLFFRALPDDSSRASGSRCAWWATLVAACAPLSWFTALRPLSDTTGLAFAVAAQALLAAVVVGRAGASALAAGAFLATLAIGVRSQSFVLTVPLLLWALFRPGVAVGARARLAALAAAAAGGLAWAVPLIVASGGLSSYLAALGSQAGEDFSGVVILWTVRSPRVAAQALVQTFLWPWGVPWLGAAVVAIAAVGALVLLWRSPRAAVLLAVVFVPYAAFHLLFHEVVTVRYALPLVIPVAYLFVVALDVPLGRPVKGSPARGLLVPLGAAALAAAGIAQAARPSWIYARDGSPAFRALADARRETAADGNLRAIGLHAFARRSVEWERDTVGARALTARQGAEWLAAAEELRRATSILFVADPRRTDLALFDPRAATLVASHSWGFAEPPFVGGARPGNTDLLRIDSPAWMLDRGWALTAEVSGVTERDGGGPHRRPSVAWIRSGTVPRLTLIGGRHLGAAGDPPVEITVTVADDEIARWSAPPGFFVRRFEIPALALGRRDPYVPLQVTSRAADGSGREVRVGLEQFDAQAEGVPMLALDEGWQEPEYNPMTAAAWRWMSDRAVLWVRPVGRDVTLSVAGESPLRYYDEPATLRVLIGDTPVDEWRPAADFRHEVRLPHAALAGADGRVTLTSDRHHVPAERGRSADRRRLATRIYSITVR